MIITLQEVQNEFCRVEELFQKEVPESETAIEADNGGYKEMLKAYMDIDPIAFEVLYHEDTNSYYEAPQDFHLYGDDSRVDWGQTLKELEELQ